MAKRKTSKRKPNNKIFIIVAAIVAMLTLYIWICPRDAGVPIFVGRRPAWSKAEWSLWVFKTPGSSILKKFAMARASSLPQARDEITTPLSAAGILKSGGCGSGGQGGDCGTPATCRTPQLRVRPFATFLLSI